VQLVAALFCFRETPEDGLYALQIAHEFVELGRVDDALTVLDSLSEAGGLNLYPCEDPSMEAGYLLADAGRHEEAIQRYRRFVQRPDVDAREKSEAWVSIGASQHEVGRFDDALTSYAEAERCYLSSHQGIDDSMREQLKLLDVARQAAVARQAFPAYALTFVSGARLAKVP
jgi:tetratricopeptide (TPR) repeat protein